MHIPSTPADRVLESRKVIDITSGSAWKLDDTLDDAQIGILGTLLSEQLTTTQWFGMVHGMALYQILGVLDADEESGGRGTGVTRATANALAVMLNTSLDRVAMSWTDVGGWKEGVPGPKAYDLAMQEIIIMGTARVWQLIGAAAEFINIPGDWLTNKDAAQGWASNTLKMMSAGGNVPRLGGILP